MHYIIQLCFARQSLATLTAAFHALDSPVTRKDDRPHLSLIGYDIPPMKLGQDETLDHVRDVSHLLDAVAAQTLAFPVTISAVGQFPGSEHVVYLAPTVTEQLLHFHRRFVSQLQHLLAPTMIQNPYYLPGSWVPHVAVSLGSEEGKLRALAGIFSSPFAQPLFGVHLISAIEFVSYPPGKLLHRAEFQLK